MTNCSAGQGRDQPSGVALILGGVRYNCYRPWIDGGDSIGLDRVDTISSHNGFTTKFFADKAQAPSKHYVSDVEAFSEGSAPTITRELSGC